MVQQLTRLTACVTLFTGVFMLSGGVSEAASRVQDTAERSIRGLIHNAGRGKRVYFADNKESTVSSTESKVTGNGISSDTSGWGGIPFK